MTLDMFFACKLWQCQMLAHRNVMYNTCILNKCYFCAVGNNTRLGDSKSDVVSGSLHFLPGRVRTVILGRAVVSVP